MNNHPHEIKMEHINMGHQQQHHEQHEMKLSGHPHEMHDIKMNHQQDTLHHELPVMQPHLLELNLQQLPQPPEEMTTLEIMNNKKEAIDGQAREVIFKVIKFFESEKQNRGYAFPVENVVKRACAATGLSESTIKRIKRDGLRAEATQTRMTGPKKKRVRKTKVQLDYFQLCALRGIVNSYTVRKEVPTLGKILAAAKHELNYRGGKESLRLILLNKLGIKFKKCEKKCKKPPEQSPPPQAPPVQNIMPQQAPMHHMKVMETQCVPQHYTNMIPPVSY
ncbi:hypothetical protein NE865_10421 [Phthorimaea operculella]|nr:hypothetical protein NE865_10421 [Phthorimaea operculella]